MDNWKKGDDYMLEKKGNGGEFEWKIMVEPHLWFVSCLCFWRGRCFCLFCLLGRKMYKLYTVHKIGLTLSLISISVGYSLWQGWWTRGQHNIISYLLILYIYFIFTHSGQFKNLETITIYRSHISFKFTM